GEATRALGCGRSGQSPRPIRNVRSAAWAAWMRPVEVRPGPGTDDPEYALVRVIGVSPCRISTTVRGSSSSNRIAAPDGRTRGRGDAVIETPCSSRGIRPSDQDPPALLAPDDLLGRCGV